MAVNEGGYLGYSPVMYRKFISVLVGNFIGNGQQIRGLNNIK